MNTSGITPVVLDEKSVKKLEELLKKRRKLIDENRELLMKRAMKKDFTTVRLLKNIK